MAAFIGYKAKEATDPMLEGFVEGAPWPEEWQKKLNRPARPPREINQRH